ncbi:NAD(P)-dependent oxidoreductase [Spirillospora albida]|uniref:NAD(P)-dependent oxidoreductase n=1 Tax=Spirillospora albida TaxID=58123 RepID=UPI0004C0CC74|nr:NAD(P)H-binding protein [Spirillospora albida]
MDIVVFGAGGRAGRRAVAEARKRGHRVTPVVRDPARHDLRDAVAGDATDAASIAKAAAGHDAAISTAVDLAADARGFFAGASRALDTGLTRAGVRRLVVAGLASILPGSSGIPLMDEPGYPNEYRAFYLGHAAGLQALRDGTLDWAYIAPSGDFDHDGAPTGRYQVADHADRDAGITYEDFAIALVDEAEAPRHHRTALSVRRP